jgi:hypothetical protein
MYIANAVATLINVKIQSLLAVRLAVLYVKYLRPVTTLIAECALDFMEG